MADKLQLTKSEREEIRENIKEFFKNENVGIEEVEEVYFEDSEGSDGIVTSTNVVVKSHTSDIGLHDLSDKTTIFRVEKLDEYRMWDLHINDKEFLEEGDN